jgi:hypothetical protein
LLLVSASGCVLADFQRVSGSPVDASERGPVAWWKLDEGMGLTTADATGHGHTGMLLNSVTWAPGHSGAALSFGGTDGLVDTGMSADLDLTGSLSITAWINPRSFGGGQFGRIVDRRGPGQGYYLLLDGRNGNLLILAKDGASPSESANSSPFAIGLNFWQHVAATYDASISMRSNVSLYVGGTLVGTGVWASGPTSSQNPLYLGAQPGSLYRTFDGLIDDVRIYDRPLSQSEIQAMAAQ